MQREQTVYPEPWPQVPTLPPGLRPPPLSVQFRERFARALSDLLLRTTLHDVGRTTTDSILQTGKPKLREFTQHGNSHFLLVLPEFLFSESLPPL